MKGIAWLVALILLLYFLSRSNEKYCACGAG